MVQKRCSESPNQKKTLAKVAKIQPDMTRIRLAILAEQRLYIVIKCFKSKLDFHYPTRLKLEMEMEMEIQI